MQGYFFMPFSRTQAAGQTVVLGLVFVRYSRQFGWFVARGV